MPFPPLAALGVWMDTRARLPSSLTQFTVTLHGNPDWDRPRPRRTEPCLVETGLARETDIPCVTQEAQREAESALL